MIIFQFFIKYKFICYKIIIIAAEGFEPPTSWL